MIMCDMMFRRISLVEHMPDKKGYSLLLAVIITSAVLSTATALAGIILSEVRQTREVGDAIAAQITAEGDIEAGLFVLRKGSFELLQANEELWKSGAGHEAYEAPPLRPFRIEENDFISLPISSSDRPSTMKINRWDPGDTCENEGGESWIEVSTIAWDPENSANPFQTSHSPRAHSDYAQNESVLEILVPEHTVEIRVRALYCAIEQFNVDLPTRVILRATATRGAVRQTAEVTVPRSTPVSGLFDFVIFSECELTKGVPSLSDCE